MIKKNQLSPINRTLSGLQDPVMSFRRLSELNYTRRVKSDVLIERLIDLY